MRRRKRKAVEEIGKQLKKIFLDFSEIGKPLKKIEFCVRKIGILEKENPNFPKIFLSFWQFWGLVLTPNLLPCARMDLLDWFFSFSTTHNFNFNFKLGFSNEVTFTSAFDTKGTPGLELPSLHLTGYDPKASDARRFDTRFVLPISKLSAMTTR
jgi:hypothetical protein